MRRSIILILATAGIAGCAPTGSPAPSGQAISPADGARQCFSPDRIVNFRNTGTDQIYVRVLGGGVFAIRASGCSTTSSTLSLAVLPAPGGSSRLCVGDSARVVVSNPSFGPPQCQARVERALTDAEVEALPSRERP